MQRLPESFLETLRARVDIVDVVRRHVPTLKKAGLNYSACCPFHREKTPSFTVSSKKQFFHCFGCQANGDAIAFVMKQEGLSFMEAVERLAQEVGLPLPALETTSPEAQKAKQARLSLLEHAQAYYQSHLKADTPAAKAARAYLTQRGLDDAIQERFGIGYAPDEWHGVLEHLKAAGFSEANIENTGLIIRHEKGHYYDRFRGRILFPIRDKRGQIIGYGGRVIQPDQKPKYLNSPETPLFQKRQTLYGWYEGHQYVKSWRAALLVEGYLDVIALAQHGIYPAVATLGTAATTQHFQTLFRETPTLYCCFDGDAAGRKAAWHALETVLPLLEDGRQVHFMFLPEGTDPDSYVRDVGREGFRAALKKAYPLSAFFFETLKQQYPCRSIDDKARVAHVAKPYLQQLPMGAFRKMMEDTLEEWLAVRPAFDKKRRPFSRREWVPPPDMLNAYELVLSLIHWNPEWLNELQALAGMDAAPDSPIGRLWALAQAPDQLPHYRAKSLPDRLKNLSLDGQREELQGALRQLMVQALDSDIEGLLAQSNAPDGLDESKKQRLQTLLRQKAQWEAPS